MIFNMIFIDYVIFYVERFYENVVFHAVTKIAKFKISSILSAHLILVEL